MIGILRTVGNKKYFDVCKLEKEYETNKKDSSIMFYIFSKENGDKFTVTTDIKLNEVSSTIDGFWNECVLYNSEKKIKKLNKKYNTLETSVLARISLFFKG